MSNPPSQLISKQEVIIQASKLGFYDCGISAVAHLKQEEQRMENWLEKNMHGSMLYLTRNKDKRYDPAKLVKGAKSVITALYPYAPKNRLTEKKNYKISTYAYGIDYHKVVKDKLYQLLNIIEINTGKRHARVFVDSAPVLDRAWAQKSGLGFIGKNTMLINRKGGSYFFIGHIISDLDFEIDKTLAEKNFCGSCSLCLKACPTNALEPFSLDARKCISYQTIENKEIIPKDLKDKFGDWIFGCDICQDVCPWNREPFLHQEPCFNPPDELMKMRKNDWEKLDENKYDRLFKNSAIERAGFNRLKRNISFLKD